MLQNGVDHVLCHDDNIYIAGKKFTFQTPIASKDRSFSFYCFKNTSNENLKDKTAFEVTKQAAPTAFIASTISDSSDSSATTAFLNISATSSETSSTQVAVVNPVTAALPNQTIPIADYITYVDFGLKKLFHQPYIPNYVSHVGAFRKLIQPKTPKADYESYVEGMGHWFVEYLEPSPLVKQQESEVLKSTGAKKGLTTRKTASTKQLKSDVISVETAKKAAFSLQDVASANNSLPAQSSRRQKPLKKTVKIVLPDSAQSKDLEVDTSSKPSISRRGRSKAVSSKETELPIAKEYEEIIKNETLPEASTTSSMERTPEKSAPRRYNLRSTTKKPVQVKNDVPALILKTKKTVTQRKKILDVFKDNSDDGKLKSTNVDKPAPKKITTKTTSARATKSQVNEKEEVVTAKVKKSSRLRQP